MATKIERPPSLPSTSRAQAVSRTQPTSGVEVEARLSGAPAAPAFTEGDLRKELLPQGQHLTRSAAPEALWGAAPSRRSPFPDVAEFRRLPPEERVAKLEAMKAAREELKREIQDRVAQLDRTWRHAHLKTRTASLRDFEAKHPELTADQQQRFESALRAAEAAEAKVKALAEKAKAFGPESKKDPAQAEARRQLASELRKAREEQSKAVAAATAVIDEAGLKVDRLANAEQALDKNAPPPGSGRSLWDKIVSFFDFTAAINSYTLLLTAASEAQTKLRDHIVEQGKSDREFERLLRRQHERLRQEENVEESRAVMLRMLEAR